MRGNKVTPKRSLTIAQAVRLADEIIPPSRKVKRYGILLGMS